MCDGVGDDDGAIELDAVVVDGDGDESDVGVVAYSTIAACRTNCSHSSRT